MTKKYFFSLLCFCLAVGLSACQRKRTLSDLPGTWNGVVYLKITDDPLLKTEPIEIPMKLELRVDGNTVIGTFLNGDEKVESTAGSFDGKNLKLKFDYFDAELEGAFVRRELIGNITRTWHQKKMIRPFKMWKGGERMIVPAAAEGKDVTGEWEMKVGEGEKQRIWKLILQQKDAALTGTIISTGGDWGTMTGSFGYGKMLISRYDIINARLFNAQLNQQGQLEGTVELGQGELPRKVIATRIPASDASHTDISNKTRMINPSEVLRFSGLDFNQKVVDQSDPRFKNKVVVIEISGTWCPNCYDEAPLLNDYYARYKDQGLEILGLSFEYTGDTKRDLEQVKIFADKHKINYLTLLGGTTENDDIAKKLPQIANLSAYPTTIFVGRDGRVKKIHAGFEGPATGEKHQRLKREFEETIKELLAAD